MTTGNACNAFIFPRLATTRKRHISCANEAILFRERIVGCCCCWWNNRFAFIVSRNKLDFPPLTSVTWRKPFAALGALEACQLTVPADTAGTMYHVLFSSTLLRSLLLELSLHVFPHVFEQPPPRTWSLRGSDSSSRALRKTRTSFSLASMHVLSLVGDAIILQVSQLSWRRVQSVAQSVCFLGFSCQPRRLFISCLHSEKSSSSDGAGHVWWSILGETLGLEWIIVEFASSWLGGWAWLLFVSDGKTVPFLVFCLARRSSGKDCLECSSERSFMDDSRHSSSSFRLICCMHTTCSI